MDHSPRLVGEERTRTQMLFISIYLEHVGTTLAGGANHLGRVDFQETLAGEELAEQRAHARLNAEDRVVCLRLICTATATSQRNEKKKE